MYWWWLSFADGSLAEGEQFLGACIVQGTEMIMGVPRISDPVPQAHLLGINPGGEVQLQRIPDEREVLPEWCNRLMNREECEALDVEMKERWGL